jgi:hypothetical protein
MTYAIITIALLSLFAAGMRYGNSSTKGAPLFFIGSFALIILMCYWMMNLLLWIARM